MVFHGLCSFHIASTQFSVGAMHKHFPARQVGASLRINTARVDEARAACQPFSQQVPHSAQTADTSPRPADRPSFSRSSIHDSPIERDEGHVPSCLGLHIDLQGHDLPTSQLRVSAGPDVSPCWDCPKDCYGIAFVWAAIPANQPRGCRMVPPLDVDS